MLHLGITNAYMLAGFLNFGTEVTPSQGALYFAKILTLAYFAQNVLPYEG